MQALLRASLKNNYLYQNKRILRDFNIFTRKNKRCYVSLAIPYIKPSPSTGHQTVTIMNLKIYCF